MSQIHKTKLTAGLYTVEIKDADLLICCGCPPDTIKYLRKSGYLQKDIPHSFPNAMLLADTFVQRGRLSNFAEFPIMELLYNQGMIRNAGKGKDLPLLIGTEEIVDAQANYLCRGNYGYYTTEEMKEAGLDDASIQKCWNIKLFFSDNKIFGPDDLCLKLKIGREKVEIKNKVFISRANPGQFLIEFNDESCIVDFNPGKNGERELPYKLNDYQLTFSDFAVIHNGEGNGWEPENPCMGGLIMFKGKVYAVDVGPGFMDNVNHLGLDVQDIEGLFLTHIHDDHFAGITDLLKSTRKIPLYTSRLVRITAQKKFSELLNLKSEAFHLYFDCRDLELDQWNDVDGLLVKPFFSPHPVETNAFIFKVTEGGKDYKYAHLADTFSIGDLYILHQRGILDGTELNSIISNYQEGCTLKKVDVGGGAIHGDKTDYLEDTSDKIVFSHNKFPSVYSNKKEVQQPSFGLCDVLLQGDEGQLLQQNFVGIIQHHFPDLSKEDAGELFAKGELVKLARNKILEVHEGRIAVILHGNFCRPNVRFPEKKLYERSYILGFIYLFDDGFGEFLVNTSFASVLLFDKKTFSAAIQHLDSWRYIEEHKDEVRTLANSELFAHALSSEAVFDLIQHAQEEDVDQMNSFDAHTIKDLFFLNEGRVRVLKSGIEIGQLNKGDFFGGNRLFKFFNKESNLEYQIDKSSKLLRVKEEFFSKVPLVNWMIYEEITLNEFHKSEYITPMQEELIEALNKSDLFRVLDAEAQLNVAKVVHRVTVKAGQAIVKEGEASDRLFLIVNGIGVVKKGLANEPEKILAYLMPGNTFGEVGILEHKPRSATVSALTDAELIEIPSELFEDLLMKFPKLGIELAKMLGYYLTQTNNRITRGNKDNHLIAVFKIGKCKSGLAFSHSIAEQIAEQTGHKSVYIHYEGQQTSGKLTSQFKFDSETNNYDILTNWSELNFPVDSRISMTADRLLNTYDNLIIYFETLPQENLSIILENVNQAIIISDKNSWEEAVTWREHLMRQISHRNVEFFMLTEEKIDKVKEENIYRFPERSVSSDGLLGFDKTVRLIADRLERNNRVGIFIPTTIDVNQKLDTSEFVNDTLAFLGKTFGGATSEEAIGVWNSKDIGIVDEKVFIVHSYTTAKMLRENLNQVVDYVKSMKGKLKQESMALEINKRLTLI